MTTTTTGSTPFNYRRNSAYASLQSQEIHKLIFYAQAPPASYVPDAPQRLKKRRVGSEQEKAANEKKKANEDKERMSRFNPYSTNPTHLSTAKEVKLGGYYSPELLPDYLPHEFNLEHDKLVQHNIVDTSGELIPCWNNSVQLREGTLILCLITLHTWNIPGTGHEGYKNFKRVRPIIFHFQTKY
jgi:hypothetical protein